MKIQVLQAVKSKPIIALKFKGFRVLLMHCTDHNENRLKPSLNSMTRMEVTVKLMEDKMHIYVRSTSIRLSNEKP